MLSITQYIFWPLPFRNPPDIFCRFFAFLRSLSLMLSSKGTRKSSANSRWSFPIFPACSALFLFLLRIFVLRFLFPPPLPEHLPVLLFIFSHFLHPEGFLSSFHILFSGTVYPCQPSTSSLTSCSRFFHILFQVS